VVAVFILLGALLGPIALGLVDIGFDSPVLQVLATLALALVLFSDGVTLNLKELKPRARLLAVILGPGTLVPAAVVAVAAHYLLGLPAPGAAILGAALASTDPVLLRNVLRSRALPDDTRLALRLETGLNDIMLLPIVVLAMLVWAPGVTVHGTESPGLLRSALGLFLLGPALGVAVGWIGISALSWVRRRAGVRRDYESLYALGLAFAAYAAAEGVGGSGFVAAFAAGIVIDAQDSELCDCFLEYGEATAEMFLLLTFVALGGTLIWLGLDVLDGRTLLFALIALGVRSTVLYPMLGGHGLASRDRLLISMLGPRGLSSLLLVLLPVFAGISGAESLFAHASLVVLLSVALHGGLIWWVARSGAARVAAIAGDEPKRTHIEPTAATSEPPAVPIRISLDEVDALRATGQSVVLGDARKDDVYFTDGRRAAAAVRLDPYDPVLDARASGVPREATIAVYCA
jgi:NhaP-type Na+/H+ or K+/H+ antiporter